MFKIGGVIMSRSWTWRKHQEERMIAKRLNALKLNDCDFDYDHEFGVRTGSYEWYLPIKHALGKYNLVCSCWVCRDQKYRDTMRHRVKQEFQNQLKLENFEEIITSEIKVRDW